MRLRAVRAVFASSTKRSNSPIQRLPLTSSLSAPADDDEAVPARRRKAKEGRTDRAGTDRDQEPAAPALPHRVAQGGFRLVKGDPDRGRMRVRVRLAYDIRRGNPLAKFHPADADLRTLKQETNDGSVTVDSVTAEAKKGLIIASP